MSWIKCSERMPPQDGTEFLFYTVHGDIEIAKWEVSEYEHFVPVHGTKFFTSERSTHGYWNTSSDATHWQALPEPPHE